MSEMISFVIPLYNAKDYIKDSLESLLNQTYDNKEVIVVNDGSTDNSLEVINPYLDKITLINQENSGAAAARNTGLKSAKGKYLMFLDADDFLASNDVIEKALALMEKEGVDLYVGQVNAVNQNKEFIEKVELEYSFIKDEKLKRCLINGFPCNKIFKNDIIQRNDVVFEKAYSGEDLSFYLKYLVFVNNIYVSDELMTNYRVVSNSVSRTASLKNLEIVKAFDDVEQFYKKHGVYQENIKYLNVVRLLHYQIHHARYPEYKKDDQLHVKTFLMMKMDELEFRESDYIKEDYLYIKKLKRNAKLRDLSIYSLFKKIK